MCSRYLTGNHGVCAMNDRSSSHWMRRYDVNWNGTPTGEGTCASISKFRQWVSCCENARKHMGLHVQIESKKFQFLRRQSDSKKTYKMVLLWHWVNGRKVVGEQNPSTWTRETHDRVITHSIYLEIRIRHLCLGTPHPLFTVPPVSMTNYICILKYLPMVVMILNLSISPTDERTSHCTCIPEQSRHTPTTSTCFRQWSHLVFWRSNSMLLQPWHSPIMCSMSVMSGRLVWLDLSPVLQVVVVSGSDSMQLVLKPLSESLGRLILLVRIGVRGDGVGL